eukprot:CAMPEP_0172507048 /NCGR_PEP_ID=MMETSP1066-20121228/200871_1 /TAXON_ID=671091 /ORGANISM="Coscinodiscus wailesii, Strain CCMP2513" /LENGTH=150 /DNA_ID=CAMNT_0013284421 /DNA_START=66 /DNA_END=514 /DNA_ORIENTATION=+
MTASSLSLVTQNAIDEVIEVNTPISAEDVFTVALAEGIAGSAAAISTFIFGKRVISSSPLSSSISQGNYFLTRSAAYLLLSSFGGLSRTVSSVASALLATVPYQIMKINSNRQMIRKGNNRMKTRMTEQFDQDKEVLLGFDVVEVFRDTT